MAEARDLKSFWERFKTGIEVSVASSEPHKLLGVRDGMRRVLGQGLQHDVPVAVVPHGEMERAAFLPVSDEEAIGAARQSARRLEEELGAVYHFHVANEGGLHAVEVDGELRYFVRTWTVIRCVLGEAWGASGSVQLPERLVEGLAHQEMAAAIPARRRSGGMVAALTGGLENRRTAVAAATANALSTLFYGTIEGRGPLR